MTVATVILVPDPAVALEPIDGELPLRRILRCAWAGGSTPAVIVSPDPDHLLRAALDRGALGDDGAPSLLVPGDEIPHGVGWFAAGLEEAARRVTDTRAALLWPFRYPWVDPETVTSLIEAHGRAPDAIIRPAFRADPGFPALVPLAYAEALRAMPGRNGPDALGDLAAAGARADIVELGDPGTVFDLATPRDRLPDYQGPPEPAGGPPPDWNEAIGARAADSPGDEGAIALEGAAAPYDQSGREP